MQLRGQVAPSKVSNNLREFEINYTFTRRDEKVNLDQIKTNYILDTNGIIFEITERSPKKSTLSVVGGDNRFLYQKDTTEYRENYITLPQIKTIKEISRFMSYSPYDFIIIKSDNEYLLGLVKSYYYNFKG